MRTIDGNYMTAKNKQFCNSEASVRKNLQCFIFKIVFKFSRIFNELKRCKFKELSGFIVATAEWILAFNDLSKTNRTSSSTQWRAEECIHQSRHYLYDRVHACHTGSVDGMDRPNYIQTLKRTGNYTHIYAIFLITRITRCDRIWFIIKPLCQELLTEFESLLDKERVWNRIMALN